MKISRSKGKKNLISLKIDGKLDIYTVKEFKEQIKVFINTNNDLELDCQGIEKLDSAGYQMIVFLHREVNEIGRKLNIIKPSEDMKQVFNLYNEESLLSE
ncbi:lipid asymmetry maintenance protein MlaB [Spirochaetota bacterium]